MDKKHIKKFFENQIVIKLNLKNGKYYTGKIIEFGEESFILRDKFGKELPFSFDMVGYIDEVNGGLYDG